MKALTLTLPLLLIPVFRDSSAPAPPDPGRSLPGQVLAEGRAPASEIRGQIVDAAGEPIPGASYRVSGHEQRSDGEWHVVMYSGLSPIHTADEEGRFRVAVQPDHRLDLDFDAPGKAPSFHTRVEPTSDLKVVLREGADVAGRVVIAGGGGNAGVLGCEVGLQRPNARGDWFQTEIWTDASGYFAFPGFLADAEDWQLTVGGGVLPLEVSPGEDLDDLLIEIKVSRTGR